MSYNDLISFFARISATLVVALSFGHLMRRIKQPAVFGELIDERIFVALIVMAMVTSLISGPMMNRLQR